MLIFVGKIFGIRMLFTIWGTFSLTSSMFVIVPLSTYMLAELSWISIKFSLFPKWNTSFLSLDTLINIAYDQYINYYIYLWSILMTVGLYLQIWNQFNYLIFCSCRFHKYLLNNLEKIHCISIIFYTVWFQTANDRQYRC